MKISDTKWEEKTPIYISSTFGSKITKKKSQNLKIAGNFPNILFALIFKFFYMKNQKKINFYYSNYWGPEVVWSILVYWIDVHASILILRKNFPLHSLILVCTFLDVEKKFHLHIYSILHVYWYLSCMFINFEKKFPPARPYFGLHV